MLTQPRILTRPTRRSQSHHLSTSETIFASPPLLLASTFTNLLGPTTSLASQSSSSAVSHARYSPVCVCYNPSESSIAISSPRTYFCATLVVLMCGLSTSEVPAKQTRRCIRTSSRVSTVHLRSFSEVTMVLESTCGVSDVSLRNCSLGTLSSLVKTSRSSSRALWKSSAHPPGTSSKRPPGENSSSIHHSSLASQYRARAGGDGLAVRLLVVPSSAMTRPSWTSSLNVFVGIPRSVFDQTKPCLTPSSPMSRSEKPDLSVHAQETQPQLRRRLRPRHRSHLSSGCTQQILPYQQCQRKRRRRLLARVPYQIPQIQLRVMDSQQLPMSTTQSIRQSNL